MNWEPLIEALWTSLRVGIIILPIFILVDFVNHKYGKKIEKIIHNSQKFMPLFAALLGILPGCNVAVIVAIFFTEGVASLGTLIAALIAKSDEALYVFLPLGLKAFIPLLVAKFVLAVVAGYLVDFLPVLKQPKTKIEEEVEFCCAQHPHHEGTQGEIIHALKHTVRVVLVVFTVLAALNLAQDTFGVGYISTPLSHIKGFEPIIAALVGLIPGCGTSIAIATLYVEKVITLGAAVAGLSTASGEVFVVLAAKGVKPKHLIAIASLLVAISAVGGLIINLFYR